MDDYNCAVAVGTGVAVMVDNHRILRHTAEEAGPAEE